MISHHCPSTLETIQKANGGDGNGGTTSELTTRCVSVTQFKREKVPVMVGAPKHIFGRWGKRKIDRF